MSKETLKSNEMWSSFLDDSAKFDTAISLFSRNLSSNDLREWIVDPKNELQLLGELVVTGNPRTNIMP